MLTDISLLDLGRWRLLKTIRQHPRTAICLTADKRVDTLLMEPRTLRSKLEGLTHSIHTPNIISFRRLSRQRPRYSMPHPSCWDKESADDAPSSAFSSLTITA